MRSWVVREATQARELVGVAGLPTETHLLKLIERMNIELLHGPVDVSSCCWTKTGPRIILPQTWRGDEQDYQLAHEAGHALLTYGMGSILRHLDPDNPRMERLARMWDLRDEAVARDFARAWYRP